MLIPFLMIFCGAMFLLVYIINSFYITDKLVKKHQEEWDCIKKALIEQCRGEQEIREAFVEYLHSIDGYIPHI